MTLFCHRCLKTADHPNQGTVRERYKVNATNDSTYQCLSPDCWAASYVVFTAPEQREQLWQCFQAAERTRAARTTRVAADGVPQNIDEALTHLHGQMREYRTERAAAVVAQSRRAPTPSPSRIEEAPATPEGEVQENGHDDEPAEHICTCRTRVVRTPRRCRRIRIIRVSEATYLPY